ncbi:MAG: hypothetical protein WBA93_01640, partial [Microcoleaceae cyanobacterium]
EIEKYLVMVEDGTFLRAELNGFDRTPFRAPRYMSRFALCASKTKKSFLSLEQISRTPASSTYLFTSIQPDIILIF